MTDSETNSKIRKNFRTIKKYNRGETTIIIRIY